MAADLDALARRARRAYERGRLLSAVRRTALLLPIVGVMAFMGRFPIVTGLAAALLLGATVAFFWRGQGWGRGVVSGVAAGVAPLVFPALAHSFRHFCTSPACWQVCIAACVGAGVLAGVFVGVRAAGRSEGRSAFLASAGTVTILVGAPACAFAGLFGILGMAAGVLAASAPVAVLASARS